MIGTPPRLGTIYSGWIVLSACFVSAMLIVGSTIYSFQLFVIPVTEEFGISRATANNAYISMLVGLAIWSPLVGRLLDKFDAKYVIMFGALSFGGAFTLVAMAQSLIVMMVGIFVMLSISVCSCGGLAGNAVTVRWFQKRRGRALGVMSVTSSVGGAFMVPVISYLITSYGWRTAMLLTGWSVAMIIFVLVGLLVRGRPAPADINDFDEFDTQDDKPRQDAPIGDKTLSLKQIVTTRNYWLVAMGCGLLLASDQAVLTSKFPFLVDSGFTVLQATTIISTMTISAVAGKLIIGFMADYFDVRHLFALVALFHFLLLAVFLMRPDYWGLLIFVSIFGAAVGGIYPVWSSLTATAFGPASIGSVLGFMAPVMQGLSIIFVSFIGEVHSRTGSYDIAFQGFMATVVMSVFFIYAMNYRTKFSADSVKG